MDITPFANLKTLADRIRTLRVLKGLTQGELALAVGVKQQSIQAIESGKTKMPTGAILLNIAKELEVSPAWLAYGIEAFDNLSERALQVAQAYDDLDNEEKKKVIDLLLNIKDK